MQTVLVTGASGSWGRFALRSLRRQRPSARIIALVPSPETFELPPELDRIEIVAGSVTRPSRWAGHPALAGTFDVLHLADRVRHARHEAEILQRTHVDGTLAMIRLAARHGGRVVMASSAGTVGVFREREAWADEHSPFAEARVGRWPYHASKIAAERQGSRLAERLGVLLVRLRPPVLIGPETPLPGVLVRALRGARPGPGGFHFVDVRAAADAAVAALLHPAPRLIYHLPGTEAPMRDVFDRIHALARSAPRPRTLVPDRMRAPVTLALSRLVAGVAPRLAPRVAWLPDPVELEMGRCWWGLRSRWAAADLGWAPPPGEHTLEVGLRDHDGAWTPGEDG